MNKISCLAVLGLALLLTSTTWAETALKAPWGEAEGQIGLMAGEEIEPVGPLSFTVSGEQIAVLDTVNQRLAVSKKSGKALETLATHVRAWTLCPDGGGGFLALEDHQLSHYSNQGQVAGTFSLRPSLEIIHGYGSELYLAPDGKISLCSANQKAFSLPSPATLQNSLNDLKPEMIQSFKGRLANTKNVGNFRIKRLSAGDIRIIGEDAEGKVLVSVPIQMDGDPAGATLFKGQDSQGNLYVEVERLVGGRAELEVHRYAPGGQRLKMIPMPNDYFTTVYKKTEITPNGRVYQMLTTPEGVAVLAY